MNEPIMAARTATQTAVLARLGSAAARSGIETEAGGAGIGAAIAGLVMTLSSGNPGGRPRRGGGLANAGLRFGLDGRNHRHPRTQFDG